MLIILSTLIPLFIVLGLRLREISAGRMSSYVNRSSHKSWCREPMRCIRLTVSSKTSSVQASTSLSNGQVCPENIDPCL